MSLTLSMILSPTYHCASVHSRMMFASSLRDSLHPDSSQCETMLVMPDAYIHFLKRNASSEPLRQFGAVDFAGIDKQIDRTL